MTQTLRQQQDQAYEESLRADQEKERRKKEEKEKKRQEELEKQRLEDEEKNRREVWCISITNDYRQSLVIAQSFNNCFLLLCNLVRKSRDKR